jgi:Domain of unknown function (DUF4382)
MKTRLIAVVAILGILSMAVLACASGPSTAANFRLLVSDQPNVIGDFEHLYCTISSIGVHPVGDNSTWIPLSPKVETIDLTTLQGNNATEIWSGNLTPGQYDKVFIDVSNVDGTLFPGIGSGNETVKLPSSKLQISTPFTISGNGTLSFVFDITVIKAGESGQYILEPQIADSGVNEPFTEVKATQ